MLKVKMQENEVHFCHLMKKCWTAAKAVCAIYGEVVITDSIFVSGSLGSEVKILIRKTDNVPSGLQSLTMPKLKRRLKITQVTQHMTLQR